MHEKNFVQKTGLKKERRKDAGFSFCFDPRKRKRLETKRGFKRERKRERKKERKKERGKERVEMKEKKS